MKGGQSVKHVMTAIKTLTIAVSLCTVLLFCGLPVNAEFTYSGIMAVIPFTCSGTGSATEEYEIVIEKLDGNSPSPETDVKTVKGSGEGTFRVAVDEPGTYRYRVYENAGSNPKIIYDNTAYTVTLFVTSDDNGDLDYQVILSKDGTVKPAAVAFENMANSKTDDEKTDERIDHDGGNTGKKPAPTVSTGEAASPYIPYAVATLAAGGLILILALRIRRRKEDADV